MVFAPATVLWRPLLPVTSTMRSTPMSASTAALALTTVLSRRLPRTDQWQKRGCRLWTAPLFLPKNERSWFCGVTTAPLGKRSPAETGPGGIPHGHRLHSSGGFLSPRSPGPVFWIWALALVFCRCCCFTTEPGSRATALELDANACALARKNLEANGLGQRSTVIQGDLRAYREILAPGAFDLTVSNPPYFSAGQRPPGRSWHGACQER